MTTGTLGSWPPQVLLVQGPQWAKNWSGTDGKYETYAGGQRLKWNSYSVSGYSILCYQANFVGRMTWYSDANFWWPWDSNVLINKVPSFIDIPVDTSNKSKVLEKLLERIKGHDFNLGVDLGQMGQTVDLLSGNLRKLGRSALALRRGDFATAARQLGARPRGTRLKPSDVSGRWLELQYGWLPLLSSSYEAAKAFEAISNGVRKTVFTVSSARKVDWDLSQAPSQYTVPVRGKCGRRLQYEMYEEMSVERQLGLEDPLSILWELTPWSFVIDWFYPIGNYLSNLNQIPKLKGRWLVTDFLKFDRQRPAIRWKQASPWGPNWVHSIFPPTPSMDWSSTVVERTYSATPPSVPAPKFNLKGVNSSRRFWNAVSLAHQRFLK